MMAQDALIKLRCSQELKDRLKALARSRHQKLSDYIRQRLVDVLEDSRVSEGEQAPYGVSGIEKNSERAGKRAATVRTPRKPRRPLPPATDAGS